MSFPLMRRLLPTVLIASFAFAAPAYAKTTFVIKGGGFGHGVGMSQYGTLGFAQHGKGYREILRHYYTDTQLGRLDATPTVRVLLQANRSSVSFTGASAAGTQPLQPGLRYSTAPYRGGVVLRSASGKKIKTFTSPLRVVGGRGRPVTLVGGPMAGSYRGAIELRPAQFGGMNAINAVDLESYVRGVVSAESPSSWPAEALKTQAVAARTYAITTSKQGDGWDQYPDTRSQVYRGVAAETPTTDSAVAATRNEVVTYRGEPVVTYFFSTSGGRTENVEYGFGGGEPKPWLKSVDDPYDDVSPRHKWGPFRMTLGQAQRKLGGLVKGRFRSVRVTQRGVSPRIVNAKVVGTGGTTTVSGPTLRTRFGLYDSWMYFSVIRTGAKKRPAPKDDVTADPGTGGVAPQARSASRVRGVIAGSIDPGRRGGKVVVQRRSAAGFWQVEARTKLRRGGRYSVAVARPGVYRVVSGGVAGLSVTLR